MDFKLAWVPLVAMSAIGCTKTVMLTETDPVLVSARAPEPPPPPEPEPPPRVEVQKERIQVNDTIHFEFNSDKIRPDSFDLLAEIARVINEHPEIRKLRVEGHTDNIGSSRFNLDLSKRRARSVKNHLVKQGGVDAARLAMDGYGFDRPIDTNDTDEGRARNRRVEFNILERDEEAAEAQAAAGAGDGDDADGDEEGATE